METVHDATVARVERLSERMVRISLALDEPSAWVTTGRPDEFVHVEVGADTLDPDGHSSRHYTVSAVTPDGFELEIFLHGDGPGATWARGVVAGDRTRVSDPKAYYGVPAGSGVRILAGDLTALPAIARALAEAHADEVFRVIVEVPSMDDARDLPTAAAARIDWVVGGNGHGASVLRDALTGLAQDSDLLDPESLSYVWVACESVHSRRIRQLLRREFSLVLGQYRIVGYWHADLERALRVWEEASDEQKAQYAALWREDRSDEENWLELEPFLQRMGV
ncbi:siderophore-interacting protein [Demequina lignilytica]|uniref:Siderophore-interacting protein n=1 Tax=Demequina lignilytica TaxID=3051663 RepID=A0AB35MHR0_9MICO|nr:siderophore-interacting protein [Demequina sp. SYSU T0a273]MDN4483359.1 siderophore-interacting protein [Demequina sp. SYSU T0a273]